MMSVQGVDLDANARRVWRDGVEIRMSNKEFDLLHALISRPGEIVTREELMRDVWQTNFWTSAKTIDVHLGWVRKKLGDDTRRPTLITTIRGRGLRFEVTAPVYADVVSPVSGGRRAGRAHRQDGLLTPRPAAARYARRVTAPPSATPVLAVIGGGQLARMMAQAAVGLGVPLRLLAEGPDVSAAQVVPRPAGRRLPRPRDAARGRGRLLGGDLRPRARARPSTCTP